MTARELRRRRAAAQLLLGPERGDAATVVRRLLAVQAQDAHAAALALRARTTGLTATEVDRALTEDRAVVVAWMLRGTLHMVAAEDHAWLLALTAPGRMTSNARRLGQESVTPDAAARATGVIERALVDDGPLSRAELGERLAAAGVPTAGQALPHLLMRAALLGIAVLAPVHDGERCLAAARDWLAPAPAPPDPLAELARRYLRGHGPATAADLAGWAGLPLRDARAGLAAIAGELDDLGDGLADLTARAGSRPADPPPRLLPAFDPYLLGWRDRSFAVAPEHARAVHPGGGLLRAVATAGGRVVGTWTLRRRSGSAYVALEPFGARLPVGARAALEDEAGDVARFEGLRPAAA